MKEKNYYEPVKRVFEKLFKEKGDAYLEITADGQPSNKLKEKIRNRDIIFSFLNDARPDITGFLPQQFSSKFIIIEIKEGEIKLDHIYQTRKYIDLFEAYFGFLVSTKEIPVEIKKLTDITHSILNVGQYRSFILCQYDADTESIVDWHKENPFEINYYWR
ncbi:MAG: hypothetical protein ACRD9Q_09330 [Nitrososphaeraceae archaeon]